jgi:hypothetical protein
MFNRPSPAVYGLIHIPHLADITEAIGEDVLPFVNTITTLIHTVAHRWHGLPTTHVGNNLQISWNLPEEAKRDVMGEQGLKEAKRADFALMAMVKVRENKGFALMVMVKVREKKGVAVIAMVKVRENKGFALMVMIKVRERKLWFFLLIGKLLGTEFLRFMILQARILINMHCIK